MPLSAEEKKRRHKEAVARYRAKNREKILAKNREYARKAQQTEEGRAKKAAASRRHYLKHKERILARNQKYYKQYYAENTDKENSRRKRHMDKHKDYYNEYHKWYRENNRGKFVAKSVRYEQRKECRTPSWLTDSDHQEIEDFYTEAARLTDLTGIPFQVDHIIPLKGKKVSGLHVPENLQILQYQENCRKSNKF